MNIGNVKGMLGDAVSNEVRTLELKIGQVVRGVVLQQYDNSEALVNINGVQVRAKLEIPLMEGQAALLQVQPDSKGAYILLKQVDPTSLGLGDPMKDILKAMSLPDKAWANEIIKDLRREGFPLNKETAAAFQNAAQLIPSGASQEAWMHAAATAFKRGLPITQATVSALYQLQNGSPIHQLMEQLKGQLTNLIQANSGSQPVSSQTNALVNQLLSLLDNSSTVMSSIVTNGSTAQSQAQSSNAGQGQGGLQQSVAQAQVAVSEQAANSQVTQQSNTNAGANISNQNNLALLLKLLGVNHEAVLGKSVLSQQSSATTNQAAAQLQQSPTQQAAPNFTGILPSASTTQAQAQSNIQPQAATTLAQQTVQQAQTLQPHNTALNQQAASETVNTVQQPSGTAAQSAAQQPSSASAQHLTQQPLATQQQPATVVAQAAPSGVVQIPVSQEVMTPVQPLHQAIIGAQQADNSLPQLQGQAAAQAQSGQHTAESLKASIMQMIQNSDTPPAVKETAQQLLSAITGQQLMLSTERNHSVFSHVTMYIPLQDKDGSQTATVHIQTRRDRKGELDSDNCRLVFDLNMNAIGPTLVDVNIINKIVSLNLWNDHPFIAPIVEGLKSEINVALTQNGYVLSSLRTTPIPAAGDDNIQTPEAKKPQLPPDVELINSTRYKGVDFKV